MTIREQLLRLRQHKIKHQHGRVRMRRIADHRNGVRMRHDRIKREPVDRCAFALELLGRVVKGRQRQRHLAHRHQIGEQRVTLADREAVGLGDVAKELEALLLPHHLDETGEPVGIVGLDRNPAFPFRIEQVLVALRQVGFLHQIGIVGGDQHIQTEARPGSIGWDRGRHQVGEIGRLDLGEELLGIQRLHGGRVVEHEINVVAPGACLVEDALADVLGAGAIEIDLDPVFLLEGGDERGVVLGRSVRIERDRALALGAFDQALGAVRALVVRDLGEASRLRGHNAARQQEHHEARERGEREHDPAHLLGIAIFPEPVVPGHGGLPAWANDRPQKHGGQPLRRSPSPSRRSACGPDCRRASSRSSPPECRAPQASAGSRETRWRSRARHGARAWSCAPRPMRE